MNLNRCSKAALALVVLLAAVAAPAVATTVDDSAPVESAEVGSEVTVSYTLNDLYENATSYTLRGETGLTDPTWIVATYDNQGNKLGDNRTVDTANFTQAIDGEVDEVVVRLTGTVPDLANYTYDPAQQVTLAEFVRVQGNADTVISADTTRFYTADSQAAREAIQNASTAIEDAKDAGASVSGAEDTLSNAISAFDAENFQNALDLAEEAESKATSSKQSSQTQSTLLMAGAGVVVLLLVGGGIYWYRSNQDDYDELG
jgi:hypothetical protein